MRRIAASESIPIFLGHLAENEATIVEFDVSDWKELFGESGQFSVWAKRNCDTAFYPCESFYSDGKVLWEVKDSDVSVPGQGMCGLIYQFGEAGRAKSILYSTYVSEGVVGGDEIPAPYADWVNDVLEAANNAENAVNHYPYIDEASAHWMVWDSASSCFADTGISATGVMPQKGVDYFTSDEIAEIVQAAAESVDLSAALSDLQLDEIFLTVTDAEKSMWNAKQNAITDLETIRSGAAAGATALQTETDPTVPAWAKQTQKPTYTASEVGALPNDTEFVTPTELAAVTAKIPTQASSTNQLADKDFVNSSVQTATANFRGNWDTWADVPTDARSYPVDYSGTRTPSTNDYMVVVDASDVPYAGPDTEEVTYPYEGTWRFKYGGVWTADGKNGWNAEYQVNETPMTAAQLAALNSGITAALVAQISAPIQRQTGTLTAGNTSATVTFTGVPVSVLIKDATTGESVIADIVYTTNSVTVNIAEAYAHNLNITVAYSAN